MKRQLTLQAEGLNGQLDNVWPDVKDSAWIGGTAEGWERVPYWLDGFLPLAYLLQNDARGLLLRAIPWAPKKTSNSILTDAPNCG